MQFSGVYDLTAVSADAPGNLRLCTPKLGLRLAKKTVNQDDVSAYHLFYADGIAAPRTDITFFDFPTRPEKRGNNTVTRTGMRVAGEASLRWWQEQLNKAKVEAGDIVERDCRVTLDFEDPEGQRLALVDDDARTQRRAVRDRRRRTWICRR
jgi:glyoxalase family protein